VAATERKDAAVTLRERSQEFIESPLFVRFITAVIVINAITLGLETWPAAMERAGRVLMFIDRLALVIFTVELTFKLWALRAELRALVDQRVIAAPGTQKE
jgi:hypothetical protein